MHITPPSKKIQGLLIIVVALFISYFLYNSGVKQSVLSLFSSKSTTYNSLQTVVDEKAVESSIDSDKDGLKDWQEPLWGTDVNSVDTDKDGTPDGEEVSLGRDPTVKGPNDSLEKTRGVSNSSLDAFANSQTEDNSNVSTQLSHSLFAQFMSAQSEGNLTTDREAQIVSNSISNINAGTIPPKYTFGELKLSTDSVSAEKTYANNFATILIDNNTALDGQQSNTRALSIYQTMIEKLAKLPVPPVLALNHLKIINSFNVSHETLSIMQQDNKSDPVKALLALKTYQTTQDDLKRLFTSVANELKKNAILFDKGEPGYNIWNQ